MSLKLNHPPPSVEGHSDYVSTTLQGSYHYGCNLSLSFQQLLAGVANLPGHPFGGKGGRKYSSWYTVQVCLMCPVKKQAAWRFNNSHNTRSDTIYNVLLQGIGQESFPAGKVARLHVRRVDRCEVLALLPGIRLSGKSIPSSSSARANSSPNPCSNPYTVGRFIAWWSR